MGNEHGTFGECAEQFRNDYLHNSGRSAGLSGIISTQYNYWSKKRPKGKLTVMSKPMGVSAYKVTSSLPEELQRQLPSIEDIEKRIQRE